MKELVIIFSAPSGTGKSTVINHLLTCDLGLEFSISATSRSPRGKEKNGVEYYFLSQKEFEEKIDNQEFIEYEEVYSGTYYGTLRSEIGRITNKNNVVIFDVDVMGGINLKKLFGENALAIFMVPPSIEELRNRLKIRNTDSDEMIEKRVGKASYEMGFSDQFDIVIVNEKINETKQQTEKIIRDFIEKNRSEI